MIYALIITHHANKRKTAKNMAVITETAPAQTLANGVGKLKLNGHSSCNAHVNGNGRMNGNGDASAEKEETKLVDPFNYVVSSCLVA